MNPVIFSMPGNDTLAAALAARLGAELGACSVRRFPDGESYVRVETAVQGRDAVLVCALDHPDERIAPLLFLASAARDFGATSIGLVAPYLAYLRQDARFSPGECVSANVFARWVSPHFDWLATMDPHLHRIPDLGTVYGIPVHVAHAAPAIAAWLRDNVPSPVLIGPDMESSQWVEEVSRLAGAPSVVLQKKRRGDREVEVSVPNPEALAGRTPVLVDDIVSTARTMIEAVRHIRGAGLPAPVCVAVHGIFAGDAFEALRAAGAGRIASCSTVPHASNAIPVDAVLAASVRAALDAGSSILSGPKAAA